MEETQFLEQPPQNLSFQICWVSVDPIRRKVDFYPKSIAERIEKSYNERNPLMPSACVLGSDFFNATVHFHQSGICYQTTPGISMGRAGFKQPGYRSVKRYIKYPGQDNIIVFAKQVHGEWRIAVSEDDSDIRFEESISSECLIDSNTSNVQEMLSPWKGSDLSSGAWDVYVVVWQWCRGVPERQGDLMKLSDEWWCPYMADQNEKIEIAFKAQQDSIEIELPINLGTRKIKFISGHSFGKQLDEINNKERVVRRVIKSIQEVKMMLDKMQTPPVDISALISQLPDGTTPHQFFCCITQDVMKDPVKTIDGHTYDRSSIERWFQHNNTSPLTGLPLSSIVLEPNTVLKKQIEDFISTQLANINLN